MMRGVLLALTLLAVLAIPAFAQLLKSDGSFSQPASASCWAFVDASNSSVLGPACSNGLF